VSEALGKAWKTLDEGFVECDTRQRRLGELYIGIDFLMSTFYRVLGKSFVECHSVLGKEKSSSRREGDGDGAYAKCHEILDKDSLFAECLLYWHSAKKLPMGLYASSFAECIMCHSAKTSSLSSTRRTSTRQRDHQRVPLSVPLPSALRGTR
jgi:hypothetical protein